MILRIIPIFIKNMLTSLKSYAKLKSVIIPIIATAKNKNLK